MRSRTHIRCRDSVLVPGSVGYELKFGNVVVLDYPWSTTTTTTTSAPPTRINPKP